jgi:hypothetical protein
MDDNPVYLPQCKNNARSIIDKRWATTEDLSPVRGLG